MGTLLKNSESLRALSAYTVVSETELPDISGYGILLRHKKSGARVAVVSKDDRNKVFSIGFRTPPEDSTGVAHILEHSVLNGSERYPVKEPFVELLKGSLNTFLNAMTYADKTIYPVASCNDKDYANLCAVYLDAVFCPDIYRKKEIFMQEGWHYEMEDVDKPLSYNGVVYSEMKGVFSNPEDVLFSEAARGLFPDTTYGVESGGDPDDIPTLSYEQFIAFHQRYYHPSNSYIYLYGDMDVKERLEWMDREYLSHYEVLQVDSEIATQPPFEAPKTGIKYYSVNTKEEEENAAFFSYQTALQDREDEVKLVACEILSMALLNLPGTPLKEAFTKAGLGEEFYACFVDETKQPYFAIVAKNADASRGEEFQTILMETLKGCVEQGLNKRTLLSVLNQNEFAMREADPGRYPNGLRYCQMMLGTWLYDENRVFDSLSWSPVFDKIRELIDTDYFEKLIVSLFFENPHAYMLTLLPKAGLLQEKEEALCARLAAYKAQLSDEELQQIIADQAAFKKYQETENTKEELATIPRLARSDIRRAADPFVIEKKEIDGVTTFHEELFTNDIIYVKLMFNLCKVPANMLPYVGILTLLFNKMNTSEHSYLELNNEINIETGGIAISVMNLANDKNLHEFNSFVTADAKALYSKIPMLFPLLSELLTKTQFDDTERLREILLEQKSSMESSFTDMAQGIANTRAMSYMSEVGACQEQLQGIAFYDFLCELLAHYDEQKEALLEQLRDVYGRVFTRETLILNITASKEGYDTAVKELKSILPAFRENAGDGKLTLVPEKKNEGFITPGQMQYVCMVGDYRKASLEYSGAFQVLKTAMSYDYLWTNVRVKGGAYGGTFMAMPNGRISFLSWRDPNLQRTMQVYADSVAYTEGFAADEEELTKYVIGTMSSLDMPRSPRAEGERSLLAMLAGVTYEETQKRRDEVIDVTVEDIRALALHIRAVVEQNYCCTIGSAKKLKEDAGLFMTVRDLLH